MTPSKSMVRMGSPLLLTGRLLVEEGAHGAVLGLHQLAQAHGALRVLRQGVDDHLGHLAERRRHGLQVFAQVLVPEELQDAITLVHWRPRSSRWRAGPSASRATAPGGCRRCS